MSVLELVYKAIWVLIFLGIAAGTAALAWVIIRFSLKRRVVLGAIAAASPEKIERVVRLIESIGSEQPVGGILVRTNEQTDADAVIAIPESIYDFPWAGRSISLRSESQPSFTISEEPAEETRLCGRVYRFLAIPRTKTKKGKLRNIFDPARYLKLQPELASALADICKGHPLETLSAVLCDGRIEFEPIDQPRIGTSAAWVQQPEWQYCDSCRKRMKLILQLPGSCIGQKQYREGTLYLFGCGNHPLEIKSVVQFS